MKKHYQMKVSEVLIDVKSKKDGLSKEEASARLKKYGLNELLEKNKKSNLVKFLEQFKNLMVIILLIAAFISFVVALIEKESFVESIIILLIVFLNAVMGFVQELKADKAIDSLKKMFVNDVKVKRDNKIELIDVKNVVVGDILVLEAGDYVPADSRIISAISLKVEEASLTGESGSVNKKDIIINEECIISDRVNMIYSGTNVVYGKCEAVVVNTGMFTEIGKIAKSISNEVEVETPLQKKIHNISKLLTYLVIIIVFIMFIIGTIQGNDFLSIFVIAISLAVAAIPEGLPAVITIILSLGMTKLAKSNAVVRKISSVETLGSTEVICSDKTGTITKNMMEVREFYYNKKFFVKASEDIINKILYLCNDVSHDGKEYLGDPTEIALYKYVVDNKLDKEINNKRVYEFPFDSERKLMSTINEDKKDNIVLVKGSLEAILSISKNYYVNGKVKKITKKDKEDILKSEKVLSDKALRVLGLAYKSISDKKTYKMSEVECDLTFIGLVGMIDPPRESVKESIKSCLCAGIKPVMITGDSLNTAIAIASEVGIYKKGDIAIEGIELDEISDEELIKKVKDYSVYARVTPEHKLRIVKAWQKNNKVVAMTGDGVNDAPAIKSADVGIGMGITGTEVSKNVADIVLIDDSFSTIVVAVEEGRNIYENIRKAISYLLTANIAEIIIVFVSMLFGTSIFLPIHLLYINLVTDSFPAIALSYEKNDKDIMKRKARSNKSSIFTPLLTSRIVFSSVFKAILILVMYYTASNIFGDDKAVTMAFISLIFIELTFAINSRNLHRSVVNKNFFENRIMNYVVILLLALQVIIIATPLKGFFELVSLEFIEYIYIFIFVVISFIVNELIKPIMNDVFKDE